jgi:hypothetical protein
MRKMTFAVFLFCFIQTYAKTPIPEALLNAKTAVVNNAGAEDKDFARFCEALKEWGRFEFVQDRGKADIVITLSADIQNRNIQIPNTTAGAGGVFAGGVRSQPVIINLINIINARDNTPLWSDETSVDSKDPKRLVANLKNRMKKK